MATKIRTYDKLKDFQKVRDFLEDNYSLGTPPLNWCWARWEYMMAHPYIKKVDDKLNKIGIWEYGNKMVGMVHFEHELGWAYFEQDIKYPQLKKEMLEYAEDNLSVAENLPALSVRQAGGRQGGKKVLHAYICKNDIKLTKIAKEKRYVIKPDKNEKVTLMKITPKLLEYSLPRGFKIQTLADENDLEKINRVLHRGFDHKGEPPKSKLAGRKMMQEAPSFRKDLTVVAVAPNGNYVSFCGSWYDSKNKFTYIEPAATDPDFRKMGLGRAVVLEAIKRNYELGAKHALVGSAKTFYKKLGFEDFFERVCWVRSF